MKTAIISTLIYLTCIAGSSAGEVNIYSSRQPELIDPILQVFTEQTGIDMNVVFLSKGMIERLVAEGRRSPADLVLTSDIANLNAIVEAGVTQSVNSEVITGNIPEIYRDPEGHWFGLTARARVFYASKDRVLADEITSYEQLADENWRGRICVRSGTHNYNIALTAAYLAHHGEAATIEWLHGVKANLARRPQGNDRAQIKAVWAGECDIAIGNTYYMGNMLADSEQAQWANSVTLIFPNIGGAGTHINVSGMAMTAAAPNFDNALLLMEFLTNAQAQELYAEVNFEYPLLEGTIPSALVASWGGYNADTTPLMDIARLRSAALRLIERVDFDE